MEDVRDPYWKRNPDVVAEESAAALYGEEPNPDDDMELAAQLAEELSLYFDNCGNCIREEYPC